MRPYFKMSEFCIFFVSLNLGREEVRLEFMLMIEISGNFNLLLKEHEKRFISNCIKVNLFDTIQYLNAMKSKHVVQSIPTFVLFIKKPSKKYIITLFERMK